jgi:hypothetical protein
LRSLLKLEDLKVGDSIYLAMNVLDTLKKPTDFIKLEYYKDVTDKDIKYYKDKGNIDFINAYKSFQSNPNDNRKLYIDDTILYTKGKLFIEKKLTTNYPSFIKITTLYSDFNNINSIGFTNPNSPFQFSIRDGSSINKTPMPSGVYPIKAIDINNVKFKVVKYQYDELIISCKDYIIAGLFLFNKKFNSQYLFFNKDVYNRQKQFEDSANFSKKFTIGYESLYNYKITNKISCYKPTKLRLVPFDIWLIGIQEIDEEGNPIENEVFFKIDELAEKELLYYDCFYPKWKLEKSKYEQYLIKNFTPKEIQAIRKGEVFIGMRENALYESVGQPENTNTTIVAGLTSKQCVYGEGSYVYITNGKVSTIQNFESFR